MTNNNEWEKKILKLISMEYVLHEGSVKILQEQRPFSVDVNKIAELKYQSMEKLSKEITSLFQETLDKTIKAERERQADKIKHHFNGFGGTLGFTRVELLDLLKQ